MAEALALIGLISNVMQFVELGRSIFVKFREARSSVQGATTENAQIESDVQAVKLLVENVENQLNDSLSQDMSQNTKKELRDFLVAWKAVATRLLQFLEDHKVKNANGHRSLQVLKQVWQLEVGHSSKEKIRILREGLDKLQSMMMFSMTAIIRDEQSTLAKDVGKIKAQNESMKANTLEKLDTIQASLDTILSQAPSTKDLTDKNKWPIDVWDPLNAKLLRLLRPELQALSDETGSVLRQQELLHSLWFKTIRLRRSSIKDAYANTFKWALSGSHGFAQWLQSGHGIYWIRGKAGSGKSTLMRFLSEQEKTLTSQHLTQWTKGQNLVIASHYFWYAGNPLQKSQAGLLRTLLYTIFKQCPELMKLTCPTMLASITDYADDLWTEAALLEVFGSISETTAISTKFCFFIDGLDEFTGGEDKYHGSCEELISVLIRLSRSPHIKICVSSRPWTPFEVAFGDSQAQLRLESLTKSDIEGYIRARFASSNVFQSIKSSDHRSETEALSETLIHDIVTRAQGVFLWVSLVVSSLLKGVKIHADSVDDLQNRLNDFPDDLDELYTRMLETIEPVYLTESTRIFQTSIDADQSLPSLAYEFLHYEKSTPMYALHYSQSNTIDQVTLRTPKEIRTRLNARCKDLLEVVENSDETSFMRYQVDFHHRTVRDFLKGTTVISDIMRKRKIAHFDSLLSLCKMMLALIKKACFDNITQPDINQFFSLTDSLMHYCRKIETQCNVQPKYHEEVASDSRVLEMCEILDELDHIGIRYMNPGSGYHWTNTRDAPKGIFQEYQQNSFLGATIQARLFFYLKRQLDKDTTCLHKRGRPLLDYALRPTIVTPIVLRDIEIGPVRPVIKLLLQRGADPNHEIYIYDKQTPWVLFLRTCYDHAGRARRQGTFSSSEIAQSVVSGLSSTDIYNTICLLLGSGADPDVSFQDSSDKAVGVMETMEICEFSRGEIEEVNRLMSASRQRRSQRVGWIPWARSVFGQ